MRRESGLVLKTSVKVVNNSLLATVIPNAQTDIDLWQGLIQASGGTLNPSKSSWTPFKWTFDTLGNAHLQSPPDLLQYHITATDRTGT